MERGAVHLALAEMEQRNQPGALCTIVRSSGSTPRHTGSKMLVYPGGRIVGTVGGGQLESWTIAAALEAIQSGQARLLEYAMTDPTRGDPGVCGGQVEIFVEPITPRPTLLLIGSGHVGKSVAHLAAWLGFVVVVSDDRPEFCNPQAVPDAHAFYPLDMADLPAQFEITPWTYIVLTTRGVTVDVPGLPGLLDSPAAYLGIIGSRRRWATTVKQLTASGVSAEKLRQVHSPIGLELRAETPEEIAVSIMAEILMLRNGGSGQKMSHWETPERSGEAG